MLPIKLYDIRIFQTRRSLRMEFTLKLIKRDSIVDTCPRSIECDLEVFVDKLIIY